MKFGVVTFPGSNCNFDTVHVLKNEMGLECVELWHKDSDLQDCEFIFLPGGFSYGDYLRSGAVARFSPIMEKIIVHANNGGFVMGICNGFQILCEAGLLPGVLMRNSHQRFSCKNVNIRVETSNSLITNTLNVGDNLMIPIAHAEGNYFASEDTLKQLNDNDQVIFRYCNANGEITEEANPNGSAQNIAGICNKGRNVFGMMPHPERASESILGNTDGRRIFESIIAAVQVSS